LAPDPERWQGAIRPLPLWRPDFARRPTQWLAGFATFLLLDTAFAWLRLRVLLIPLSGLISSMGLLLLCDSPDVWPYPVVAALAVLSKQFIRVDGKHLFNPLNFGIVVGLLFASGDMTIVASRWGGGLLGLGLISLLGLVVVTRAHRLDVALTWVLTFLAGALIRSRLTGAHLETVLSPMSGAAFALFTFFMITDPMTTPESRKGRIAFIVLLGLLDATLRYDQTNHAPFYALFVLCGALPIFRRAFPPTSPEHIWQSKTATLGPRR
jgi:Na+-transporting NADH:ubiquinone oxidoreductase subunit NqrB